MAETMAFQSEVSQLLHLVTHSLYSNKEIFLRELISNASDAEDKLRFAALSQGDLYENDGDLNIKIEIDRVKRTITVSDNGIGMTKDEVIEHLGTIAKSGTKDFLKSLTGEQSSDSNLIGQFGVGFYSAFIVADKVTVRTRKAGEPEDQAVRWESDGQGEFSVDTISKAARGTEVVVHLKPEESEFLDYWRVHGIVTKYSDHISFPVMMKPEKKENPESEGEEGEAKDVTPPEFEMVNRAKALWTLPKSEVTDEEHHEFYKHISHDFNEPLLWSHNRVEGKQEYTSLLYIPAKAPFDLWHREKPHGLKLYVQRVFIMDNADKLLPMYLRFVKGVIDSNDLPLNVSRELLQSNKVIDAIRSATIKRILGMLSKLAENDKEQYQAFWDNFGNVLKEGPAEDFSNRDEVAKLLRFASTHNSDDTQNVSLADYVSRMQEGQDKIYYITADSYAAAKNSPHLEYLRKKNIEVLLLTDRIDEWLMGHLTDFDGKQLQLATKGDVDLGELSEEEKKEQEKITEDSKDFIEKIKAALGDDISDVRMTQRLVDSPACVTADANALSSHMERLLKSAGQDIEATKPIFELNPDHLLVKQLQAETDTERFNKLSKVLFEQAVLADGGQLDDPVSFVARLNELLLNK